MDLSVQFKEKEIFNFKHLNLTNVGIIIFNDFTFNIIILIWYMLYSYEIITSPNVFFAIIISLIQNIIIFIYLISKKLTTDNIIKYFIILIILKIFPIISLYQNNKINITYFDIYITCYLYLIYILIFFVIYDIILEKNASLTTIITKDFTIYDNEKNLMSSIYDTTYNDIIKRII
jgi:hypothetical protein